jgi:integrase
LDGSLFCSFCGAKQPDPTAIRSKKTRGNGQGCARKRGNVWQAEWTISTYVEDGKFHQKRGTKSGFKTKSAALRYAASEAERLAVKAAGGQDSPTLREYWELYKTSDYLDLGKSKQTAYKTAWKKLESIADRPVASLKIEELQDVVDDKASTYYPAKDMKTVLSSLYKRALAEGHARTNLSEFIRLPPLEEQEAQPFTEAEIIKFWERYSSGDTFVGFILLMIYTGMMPGELRYLECNMIDFATHEITGCGLKTKKRKKTPIVFPDILVPVLVDLCQRSTSKIGRVLCMNADKFYVEYHQAISRAGVRDLPPYSCRHTTATALALGNIAPSVIQEVMRHTKFQTTQRYIHPDMTSALSAVNQITPIVPSSNNS